MKIVATFVLLVVSTILSSGSQAQSLWSMYEPACNSNGIEADTCRCSMDSVVQSHGEAAARYVGLNMILRYDEASALMEQVGEEKAWAAGTSFEEAQYKECAPGRLARLKGTYESTDTSVTAVSAAAADSASDMAGGVSVPTTTFQTIDAFAANVPVIDLRQISGEAIADVSATFNDASLMTGGANSSMRNFLGFYRVVDLAGGIDTNDDGVADIGPGDDGYAAEVQKRSMPTKLYVSAGGSKEQVLGEARFRGGAMYAFYVRMKSDRNNQGLMGSINAANQQQSMQDLLRTMQTPQHLFFVFPAANENGVKHIKDLGNSVFSFGVLPGNAGAETAFDDAEFSFRFGM